MTRGFQAAIESQTKNHTKRDGRVAPCVAPHTTLIGEQPVGGEHLERAKEFVYLPYFLRL
eukprot:7386947-Prymnesium_polylepis.1